MNIHYTRQFCTLTAHFVFLLMSDEILLVDATSKYSYMHMYFIHVKATIPQICVGKLLITNEVLINNVPFLFKKIQNFPTISLMIRVVY